MALTLYTNPMSRGRIARWMLEELGQPYEVNYVAYGDAMKSDEYRAVNPMAKVPALVHDEAVITETPAICAYLADAFPDAGLGPTPAERADYFRWFFFAAGPVEAATSNRSMKFDPNEEQSRMAGYGNFDAMYAGLLTAFDGRPYICGERFTAADVYVGSEVVWGLQFGTLPAHPSLEAYRDRLVARPARARATELDDAALAD